MSNHIEKTVLLNTLVELSLEEAWFADYDYFIKKLGTSYNEKVANICRKLGATYDPSDEYYGIFTVTMRLTGLCGVPKDAFTKVKNEGCRLHWIH